MASGGSHQDARPQKQLVINQYCTAELQVNIGCICIYGPAWRPANPPQPPQQPSPIKVTSRQEGMVNVCGEFQPKKEVEGSGNVGESNDKLELTIMDSSGYG